jgi:predicted nuclease with TOPRIM domain
MTDRTESPVPEILKRLQQSVARLEGDVSDVASDVRSIKAHMAAFMQSEFRQDNDIAELKTRLDRIERRLELRD